MAPSMTKSIPYTSRMRIKGALAVVLLAGITVIIYTYSLGSSYLTNAGAPPVIREKTLELKTLHEVSTNETIVMNYTWTHHPFWNHGMEDFCDLVRQQQRNNTAKQPIVVVVDFSTKCRDPYHLFGLGVGNVIMGIYGLRLTAASLGVDFSFRCLDDLMDNDDRADHVLPWLQGYFKAPPTIGKQKVKTKRFSPYTPSIPGAGKACRGFLKHPLHYMSEDIRRDLRRMALTIFGPRTEAQREMARKENISLDPFIANTEIDDVAIHLRCGDVIGIRTDSYGFLRFDAYRDLISPQETSSIGIITQPFETERNRERDELYVEPCRAIVEGLVRYLEHHFENATISVRNGPQETASSAFARLVLANQTFSSLSTFSLFPAIASFGNSYIQNGNLAYFVPPIADVYDDVRTMNGTVLASSMLREAKTLPNVIAWLQNGERLY